MIGWSSEIAIFSVCVGSCYRAICLKAPQDCHFLVGALTIATQAGIFWHRGQRLHRPQSVVAAPCFFLNSSNAFMVMEGI